MSAAAEIDDVIHGEWHVRYNYSVGKVAGHFFEGLKQKKILASFAPSSGIAYLPPRAYCERSFEPCDGWVEAGHQGVIEAATIVTAAFENLPAGQCVDSAGQFRARNGPERRAGRRGQAEARDQGQGRVQGRARGADHGFPL